MTTLTQISTIAYGGDSRLASVLSETRAVVARWRLFHQTLSELAALSNRELPDLGLHRSELKRTALEAVYTS
ncbi:MAG: DUF1127 domain-containing protein [Aestuariivita sp.]|uniref:DUF1127 domain-containing protein n=1 Tax=Aestuariivita sp. TaxID=1872407 RepID=UPI003BB10692